MIKSILLVTLLVSTSYAAAPRTKLLQCNVASGGDFQEVTVIKEYNKLILGTLNSAGFPQEYELPVRQWTNQKISVPCTYSKGICGQVFVYRGVWAYKIGNVQGNCR